MSKVQRVLAQLNSWKTGYISPTAQILMGEAEELIREQQETIASLDAELEKARHRIAELQAKPKKAAKQ